MPKTLNLVTAAALALLASAVAFEPAEAKRGGGGGGWQSSGARHHHFTGARLHHHVRPFHFRHARHFHHRRFVIAAPLVYSSYDDDCTWLKRRALYTGSPYWWHRYRACIYG